MNKNDLIGHSEGFLLIVGNEHCGGTDLPLKIANFILHFGADFSIQCGKGFVKQKYIRLGDKHPGQSYALLLPSRKLSHPTGIISSKLYQLQCLIDPLINLLMGDLVHFKAVTHVFCHIHGRKERIILEHKADISLFRPHLGYVRTIHKNLSLVCGLKTTDDSQDSCLATAGGSQE